MRLWSLILLFLFTVALRAGDEAVPATTPAPAPATTPAASNAPAPTTTTATSAVPTVSAAPVVEASKPAEVAAPAITYTEYRLANKLVQVDVIDFQGAIRRVSLLSTSPIHLPAWQVKAMESKNQQVPDPAKPLAVLSAFNPGGANHNWITGIGLDDKTPWKKISGDDGHLVLSHESAAKGLRWTLRYELPADSLALRSTLTVENIGQAPTTFRPVIYPLNGVHQDDVKQDAVYLALAHHNGGATGHLTSLSLPPLPTPGHAATSTTIPVDRLDYVCVKSRFFAALWHPLGHSVRDVGVVAPTPAPAPVTTSVEGGPGATTGGPGGPQPTAMVGQTALMQVLGYGFKDFNGGHQAYVEVALLAQGGGEIVLKPRQIFEASWNTTVASMKAGDVKLLGDTAAKVEFSDGYYRFFSILAIALTFCLDWLVLLVRNYGVAVVILTVLIKLALHRTTFKQHESMMKMQKLAPELKLLQEQYKNDKQKQKMAQKQMELWKKNGVNPLGGCLPILIQIPIFTALYLTFCHSADMRGHGFLWINDLTLADQLWYLGFQIPNWMPLPNWGGQSATINPLPIIYIGVSIWMSLMQKVPPGADPQQEQMMKMMRWLPVVFGVFFYFMPSGLVLYFTINAVLSTIEIKMVRKKLGMH